MNNFPECGDDHDDDQKKCLKICNRIAYGECPSCKRKVCLEHLSEHHKIEIEPHFDILIDRANHIRQKLQTMSIQSTQQRAQQFIEAWKCRTIASIERVANDKLNEIDIASNELTCEINEFKLNSLEKLKKNMLLSSPHIHRDYVHPQELSRLEQLLNIINYHIDRYLKHELLEDNTTPNTPPTTPKQQKAVSPTLFYYDDQCYYD